jgi:hypothetical protein
VLHWQLLKLVEVKQKELIDQGVKETHNVRKSLFGQGSVVLKRPGEMKHTSMPSNAMRDKMAVKSKKHVTATRDFTMDMVGGLSVNKRL